VKRYVRVGLLAPVPFLGTATRYPRDYLVRVLALRYWRTDGSKTLAELRRRLDSVTLAEIEKWVLSHPLSAETLAALRNENVGAHVAPGENSARAAHAGALATSSANSLDAPDASLQLAAQSWQRWTLMPGLELQLATDASPITRELAARLCRAFTSLVSPRTES
jgi:hypothetical protein